MNEEGPERDPEPPPPLPDDAAADPSPSSDEAAADPSPSSDEAAADPPPSSDEAAADADHDRITASGVDRDRIGASNLDLDRITASNLGRRPTPVTRRGRAPRTDADLLDADVVAAGWGSTPRRAEEPPVQTTVRHRYRHLGELGRGAMGVVELAEDLDLQRQVALKSLAPEEAQRPGAAERLIREARLGGGMEHPNIVPVHELGMLEGGQPFFTMRRLQGRTLSEILQGYREQDDALIEQFGRVRLLTVLIQVCMAVEFAHSRGVVHRDVKPGNIMLGDFGEVQLLDWGIARRVEEPAGEDDGLSLTGTPGYMAPEQIRMVVDVAPQLADVYALGCILYEALTLQRPIEDPDPEELMVRACVEDPAPPSRRAPERSIPPELDEICLAALSREPRERTISARALARQLESFLEGARKQARLLREAEDKVFEGQALTARYEGFRQGLSYTRKEAREVRGEVMPWHGVEHKRAMWELEDQAQRLREQVVDSFGEAVGAFTAALDRVPEHREARLGLAHLWWSRFRDQEAADAEISARHSRAMVEAYDDGAFTERLRGDGQLTLMTSPSRAEVWLHTFEERDRVLVAGEARLLGRTPLRGVRLPMGSHLLVLKAEGYPDVRYPVYMRRLERHEGYVRFYTAEEIGQGFVYVPGGPFVARGGTTAYGDKEPTRDSVLPDYAVAGCPVTFREYVDFLDSLGEDEAQERLPRGALDGPYCTREEGGWTPIYDVIFEGAIREVYPDPEIIWALPVIGISWFDARSWCAWSSERRGFEVRLPLESELEKAARGVDGRAFPWGDAYDATFANWRGSRSSFSQLEPIGTHPLDVSIYGIHDLCGGVANWCDNWFKRDQGTRATRGNSWGTSGALSLAERGGHFPKTRTSTTGFRVARTLKR